VKIHEYQAKEIFRKAGVAVPRGYTADTPQAAADAFSSLGGTVAVVKAQIHAGGRGKGTILNNPSQRGVQVVRSREEAEHVAANVLGHRLVTVQTGPEGRTVHRLLIEEGCAIVKEFYLGALIDGTGREPVLIASPEGGMDIEHVAATTPERIFAEPFDPDVGLRPHQIRKLAWRLGLPQAVLGAAQEFMLALGRVFLERDCSLLEINPLALLADDRLVALDAKMTFDDNALFRHPESVDLRDLTEEEPAEVRAGEAGLSYVKLNGSIGCLVNGAGLAMSTMDLIKLHGGEPANFLDVGGGANVQQVTEAFRMLAADENIRAVLVNIFGGIMRCTTIASALIEACQSVRFGFPLVVRLEGTEAQDGCRMLADSNLNIITGTDLADAARKVVAVAQANPLKEDGHSCPS
jgi:succinyl-CoA synthetase beta subunit